MKQYRQADLYAASAAKKLFSLSDWKRWVSSTYRDDNTPAQQKKTPLMQKRVLIKKAMTEFVKNSVLGNIVQPTAAIKKRPAALKKRPAGSCHKVVLPKKRFSQKKILKRTAFGLKHR